MIRCEHYLIPCIYAKGYEIETDTPCDGSVAQCNAWRSEYETRMIAKGRPDLVKPLERKIEGIPSKDWYKYGI